MDTQMKKAPTFKHTYLDKVTDIDGQRSEMDKDRYLPL